MDVDKINYVLRYYSHLMTEQEKLANKHLFGTMNATHGGSDMKAQAQAKDEYGRLRKLLSDDPNVSIVMHEGGFGSLLESLSDDPNVLLLAREGYEAFAIRTGRRILADQRDQIVFNCCPQCGAVARTPTARQCRFCRHDWHSKETT